MTSRRRRSGEMDARVKQLLDIGREHYEAREFVPAEPYLRQVADAFPHYADIQNMLGVTFFQQGKFQLARDAFERALEINPNYTEAALNLTVTYNELGEYNEGLAVHAKMAAACVESGSLDPFVKGKIANMHADIARAYEDYRMLEDAARQYREALRLCPNFVDLRTRLGNVLRDLGDTEGAMAEYKRAKQENPRYLPPRIDLGMMLFISGDRDAAIAEWEEALEIDPNNRLAETSLRMVRANERDADHSNRTLQPRDDGEMAADEMSIMTKLDAAFDLEPTDADSENFGRDSKKES